MLATIATVVSVINGIWTFCKNLFGGSSTPRDENTQAVEVANKAGKLSADQARETRVQTDKELSENASQTDADLSAVRNADSLSDGAADVNQAIARASSHPDSNG